MNLWHDIPTGEDTPKQINVVVEIPKGAQNKYEYDKNYQMFRLDRVLFSPMHYPGDYGLVPRALGEDNDPLDALVLVSYPTYPGILIAARPIGVLPMTDNKERDNKILCVPTNDVRLENLKDISDVHKPVLNEIAHFFAVYKQLEGKDVAIGSWEDVAHAYTIITEAVERYQAAYPATQKK